MTNTRPLVQSPTILSILARLDALEAGGTPTPTPTPAPVFTQQPTISPTSGTAGTTTFTATPGSVINGTISSRAWRLNGTIISTALTVLVASGNEGTLTYRETATGSGLTTLSNLANATVQLDTSVPGNPLQRLSVSGTFRKGLATTAMLLGTMAGSTVSAIPGVTQTGTGASRSLSGTPTQRSAMVTETSGSSSRKTLLFSPVGGQRTMKFGMNPAGLVPYAPNHTLIDLFKCAEEFDAPATRDAHGYPLTLKPNGNGVYLASWLIPLEDGRTTPVKYHVITDGVFDIEVSDSTVGTSNGHPTFTYTGREAALDVNTFFAMKNLTTPPTRLSIVRDDLLASFLAGEIFKPEFLAAYSGMKHARWLNLLGTNNPNYTRRDKNDMLWNSIVPYEVIVAFARKTGTPVWLTLHHKMTNAQFSDVMALFDALAAAGLVFLEYGNEIWNFGNFLAQWIYCRDQAYANGFVGQPGDEYYAAPQYWNGMRATQLAQLAAGKGYKWKIGCQPVQQYFNTFTFQGITAAGGDVGSPSSPGTFATWTTSVYPNGGLTEQAGDYATRKAWMLANDYDAAFDNVANSTDGGSIKSLKTSWQQARTIATAHGMTLEAYESNFHFNATPNLPPEDVANWKAFFYRMQTNALARGVYGVALEEAQEAGVETVTLFDDYSLQGDGGLYGIVDKPAFQEVLDWLANGSASAPLPVPPENGSGTPTPTPGPSTLFSSNFDASPNGTLATALGLTGFGAEANQFQVLDGHLDWVKGAAPTGRSFVGVAATTSHSVDYTLQAYNFANFGLAGVVSAVDPDNLVYIRPFDNDSYPGLIVWRLMKVVSGTVTADDNGYVVTPNTDGAIISIRKVGGSILFYFGGTQYDFSGFRSTLSPSTGVGRSLADLGAAAGTNAGIFAQESAGAGGTRWVDNVAIKSL